MTAKKMKNIGGIRSASGMTKKQRYIDRSDILESSLLPNQSNGKKRLKPAVQAMFEYQEGRAALLDLEMNQRATEEKQFAKELFGNCADRKASNVSFQEQTCGHTVARGQIHCRTSAKETNDLSSIVVSLALFDGDKMLFACSGIPLPQGTSKLRLTRFVTSAKLVHVFNENRNRDDNLRVAVRLPNNTTINGFLGLYDEEIAIVTSIGVRAVDPIGSNPWLKRCDGPALAAGRAFDSCNLIAVDGCLSKDLNTFVCEDVLTEIVIGGPMIGTEDKRFLGMITKFSDAPVRHALFLPQADIYERLKCFKIINNNVKHVRRCQDSPGVHDVKYNYPSGFMKTICRLRSFNYPMPPPLVLEFNGELLNQFEERFGECLAWKGYPFGFPPGGSVKRVWAQLEKRVVADISRRVVSLASFDGHHGRHFACTGLLIRWPGTKAKAAHAIILTSASLVRSRVNDDIDRDLRIEVFRPPPMQHVSGNLEYYNLNSNVAIVSVKEKFNATRPEDIFSDVHQYPDKVLAVGRDIRLGVLMASTGEVNRRKKACKLDCKDLQFSTCKIKKVGIGGPLINFNGSFVGMNFYDGSELTPFLPRCKIVELLSRKKDYPLPSEGVHGNPLQIEDLVGTTKINKWPVPEPYWYHDGLEVSMYRMPKHIGRV